MDYIEARSWAVALIGLMVQEHLTDLDSQYRVEAEAQGRPLPWTEAEQDAIVELIDTATCTIEVDWPPRPKTRIGFQGQ